MDGLIAYLGKRWYQYTLWEEGKLECPVILKKNVQEWFEEHSKELNVLTWPLNSPDLNPIKHLLDGLEKQV